MVRAISIPSRKETVANILTVFTYPGAPGAEAEIGSESEDYGANRQNTPPRRRWSIVA